MVYPAFPRSWVWPAAVYLIRSRDGPFSQLFVASHQRRERVPPFRPGFGSCRSAPRAAVPTESSALRGFGTEQAGHRRALGLERTAVPSVTTQSRLLGTLYQWAAAGCPPRTSVPRRREGATEAATPGLCLCVCVCMSHPNICKWNLDSPLWCDPVARQHRGSSIPF